MEPQNKSHIPSLKDTKRPDFKIKGMAAGMSLVERLKTFRRKDLAFIVAGLAVLFLAPLVEHFLMAPESGQPGGAFQQGWSFRDSGSFGKGGSPYEPGISGLAPGGLLGSGAEIITPLNVRDPSALVMGPGQSAQQPVTAPPPAPTTQASASPKAPSSDWKDALAAAAGRSASAATKASAVPVPKVPLQGSLRGMGVLGGSGTGASYALPAISAAGVPNKAVVNSSPGARATTDYKGAASARGASPRTGGIEELKKAAASAAGEMNRGGGGASNLQASADASQALPSGSSSGGAGGLSSGNEDKAGGQNQDKGGKAQQYESLEYLMAKEEMQRAMELKWSKKTKEEMWPLEMELKVKETLLMDGIFKPIAKGLGTITEGAMDFITGRGSDTQMACEVGGKPQVVGANIKKCGLGSAPASGASNSYCIADPGGKCTAGPCLYINTGQPPNGETAPNGLKCSSAGLGTGTTNPNDQTPPGNVPGVNTGVSVGGVTMTPEALCTEVGKSLAQAPAAPAGSDAATTAKYAKLKADLETLAKAIGMLVPAKDAMLDRPKSAPSDCGSFQQIAIETGRVNSELNIVDYQRAISGSLAKKAGDSSADLMIVEKDEFTATAVFAAVNPLSTKVPAYKAAVGTALGAEPTAASIGAFATKAKGAKAEDPEGLVAAAKPEVEKGKTHFSLENGQPVQATLDRFNIIGKNCQEGMCQKATQYLQAVKDKLASADVMKVVNGNPDADALATGGDKLKQYWDAIKALHGKLKPVYEKLDGAQTDLANVLDDSYKVTMNMGVVFGNAHGIILKKEGAAAVQLKQLPNPQVKSVSVQAANAPQGPIALETYYKDKVNGPAKDANDLPTYTTFKKPEYYQDRAEAVAECHLPDKIPTGDGSAAAAAAAKAQANKAKTEFDALSDKMKETIEYVKAQASTDSGVGKQVSVVKSAVTANRQKIEAAVAAQPATN
ncbi:MAG: hypothetical protein HY927_10145 [Elusimicrobia bacterium]|nr:hypothetical protein [Elusimicrobiota bacterium]